MNMNNELTVWNYGDNDVRILMIDDEPWLVLADVCRVLELSTPARVAERLDDDEKGMSQIHTLGGTQNMTIISESGFYSVVLRSDKPQAKPFRKWVTSVVLPSIRKNGFYAGDMNFSRELQVLIQHERMMAQHQKQLDEVQNKIETIQDTFLLQPTNWKKYVRDTIIGIAWKQTGSYSGIHDIYIQLYDQLETRAGADLDARLRNRHNRMIQNGMSQTAVNKINKLDIIEDDKKLKEIFTAILREFSAGNI